ncbi:MAG: NnrS family protein [Gammaproteobacteria bacterium]|nr:NnrS family protein [Gammaproteobacteria bacterium]
MNLRVLDAPHRIYFAAGLAQVIASLALWSLWLAGAFTGWYAVPPLAAPPVAVHGFLMLYGLFPFFVFGFLATTFPRWLKHPPLPRARYRLPALLRIAGLLLVYAGLATRITILEAGVVILCIADSLFVTQLIGLYRRTPPAGRAGTGLFCITLSAEVIGLAVYAFALGRQDNELVQLAVRLGLFVFLLPTLFGVVFRMLPFFSAAVLPFYRNRALRHAPEVFLALGIARTALASGGHFAGLVPIDAALGGLAAFHARVWMRRDGLRHGLLALLYAGVFWIACGFLLYAAQDTGRVFGLFAGGRAPLHALGLGAALSLAVAMVTRVTRGHSGRPLHSDGVSWLALIGVQAATLLRLGASLPAVDHGIGLNLSVIAAPLAVLTLLPWTLRYGAILLAHRDR